MTIEEIQAQIATIASQSKLHWPPLIKDLLPQAKEHGYDKASLLEIIKDVAKTARLADAETQVEAAMAEMSNKYFIFNAASSVKVAHVQPHRINGHVFKQIHMHSERDFRLLEADKVVGDISVAQAYLSSEDRRVATGLTLRTDVAHGEIVDGKFNQWQGFGFEPAAGSAGPFFHHLMYLSDNNPEIYDYMRKWIAYGFQNPTKVARTALMLIGPQGSGKGLLGNMLRSMWGPHGSVIETKKSLVGDFNGHLKDTCFAFVDEPPFAGDKSAADRLKHMITEPTQRVEEKFRDSVEIDNAIKLLIATNHEWGATIDVDDRRFCVIRVPDHNAENKQHLGDFYEWSVKAENKAAVLAAMLAIDLSEFDTERDRPETRALGEQKLQSMSGVHLYWRSICELQKWSVAGTMALSEPAFEGGFTQKSAIYGHYVEWHYATKQRGNPTNNIHFWRASNKAFGGVFSQQDWRKQMPNGDRMVRCQSLRELAKIFFEFNTGDATGGADIA